ncbi:hypothetical protein [Acutalibacter sp. 1XD8-36]|uniref:hypothetical protein n=1 Tax=Acutalibacter sp. 1XD8-36 TaxID=2320852 RepID=UPI0014121612|nr:hypothetical protein [Acutalibacter sp. 1XD8-36]NBJ87972.1 hypothetical protein [Acutalibacter sp. 1XD8-36]
MMDRNYLPWWRLDNAAKIFPSTSSAHDSKVFRFFCELEEDVEPAALQTALDKTMEQFPIYRCVLRRGWFWYYLEESPLPALVRPEQLPPCFPIYPSPRRSLLFRVLYYRRRISLEVYHVLSDGAGALDFLRVLVYEYLYIRHSDDNLSANCVPVLGISDQQKEADSFQKYYEKPARRFGLSPSAYQIPGNRLPKNQLAILEGKISVKELLACARARKVTITELLTAVLLRSIYEGMPVRSRKKPVVVTVPVNLRNYFPSFSSRNFFAIIHVGYDFSKNSTDLEAVLDQVKRSFQEKLTVEKLKTHVDSLCALEHNFLARIAPLPLKDVVLRYANRIAARAATVSFSNVGKLSMPEGSEKYIRQFGVLTCAGCLQACSVSFEDSFVITFASPYRSRETERIFFQELSRLGLDVTLTTNIEKEVEQNAVL